MKRYDMLLCPDIFDIVPCDTDTDDSIRKMYTV